MKKTRIFAVIGALLLVSIASAFGAEPSPSLLLGLACIGEIDLQGVKEFLKKELDQNRDQTQQTLDQAINEVKTLGTIVGKTSDELKTLGEKSGEVQQRLLDVEQKLAKRSAGPQDAPTDIGSIVVASEEFKNIGPNGRNMQPVNVGSFSKAIVNATGASQPLVQADRIAGIITPAQRLLTIRSLIPVGTTGSNMIEFAKENVFTNNAGPQYDSPARENVAKPESNITFTLDSVPVITLAHWVAASRQVLSDAGMLAGYVNNRLMYGLKLEEEDEVINGAGTGGALTGLLDQSTAYTGAATGDQQLDTILKAFLQVTVSEYVADGVVLNHIDWTNIMLLKDDDGNYIFGNPSQGQAMNVWGRPVVPTNSIASGKFLVGAFTMAAQLWDREQSTIRIAEQHADFFVKNMVAVLAEERVALAVYRPAALVDGSF